MYTDFYHLTEKPFNLTPSPRFLYLGDIHKEALALLKYGVMERKGFILLTGEVGTGKTTMIQALLASLDNRAKYVYLSNPLLTAKDFIKYVATKTINKNFHFKTRGEVLQELEAFLNKRLQLQENFILIVDEAQTLSFELLEEIRLLSNMETGDEKLINIFLVGQPEFNDMLNDPKCRPLLQRISIRYHIKPLDLKSTEEYILTRFKLAGAEDGLKIFPKSVIKAIYKYSNGYPRMVNVMADNILLQGYSLGKKKVDPEMVEECYRDLRPEKESTGFEEQGGNGLKNNKEEFAPIPIYLKWALFSFLLAIIISLMGGTFAFFKSRQRGADLELKEIRNELKEFQSKMDSYQKDMIEALKNDSRSDEFPSAKPNAKKGLMPNEEKRDR